MASEKLKGAAFTLWHKARLIVQISNEAVRRQSRQIIFPVVVLSFL